MRLPLIALITLSACAPAGAPGPADPLPEQPPEEQKACGADELQHLVGSPVGSYDFDALDRKVRILPPGSLATMDYIPARLNVDLDANGDIVRLSCG